MPRSHILGHKSLRAGYLLSSALALVLLMPPGTARAACSARIAVDAAGTTVSLGASVVSVGVMITKGFIELNDALTRYANQLSSDDQNLVKTQSGLADTMSTKNVANALGQGRTEYSVEFTPSRAVCADVSRQKRVGATQAYYASYRNTLQMNNTSYSNNAPGSGSERGTVQAVVTTFKQRCDRYANPTTMNVPSGLSCPGPADPTMRDLDIQPWKAILDPVMFTNAAKQQAAVDAIKMLTEVVPPDPIRGNVLLRDEGRNLHVSRMRDVTRMNLARGVLENIVAMRATDPAVSDSKSRLARYIELITGKDFDPATNSLTGQLPVIMAAEEPKNAAFQSVSARLATQQALIFEILNVGEQLVAMEATELAIKVERSRASGGGAMSRPTGN